MLNAIAALLALSAAPQEKEAAPAPLKSQEIPLEAYWRDGLRFRSKDGAFDLHVGGRFILHGRTVFDRPDDETAPLRSVPDSFFARQAYLQVDGKIYEEFNFRVQADFPSGAPNQSTGAAASSVRGTLKDAWIEWNPAKEFNVRVGQYYQPISQEDWTSTLFIDFAERSVMNRLLPGREMGIKLFGSLERGLLEYQVMAANSSSLLNDQDRSVTDRDDEKALACLLFARPLLPTDDPWLGGLRLGLGASIEDVDSVPASGFDLVTRDLSILFLDSDAPGTFDGLRTRIVPQVSWELGPATLRGEYLLRRDHLDDTFAADVIVSRGWYAYATWLVTGETKVPEKRTVPAGAWGAVELLFRAAELSVSNPTSSGLVTGTGNSDRVLSLTAGVNWWLRSNLRFTLNAVREEFDDELEFDQRREDTLYGLLLRAQVDF